MIAKRLFDDGVSVAESDPRMAFWSLYPEEERIIANAVERRRREFTAGRRCARRALGAWNLPSGPIGQRPDRSPVWPDGFVGSITHTDSWCAVAVARRSDGYEAVGLDLEPAQPLPFELFPSLFRVEELAWLSSLPSADRGLSARAIFSAKEAVFKLQHELSRAMLEFEDLSVAIDWRNSAFTATFMTELAAPFGLGDELIGRIALGHGHVGCGIALRRGVTQGLAAGPTHLSPPSGALRPSPGASL